MAIQKRTYGNGYYDLPRFYFGAFSPDLSLFNPENTYYVTWSLEGDSYIPNDLIRINQPPPEGWCDYNQNKYANIVVIENEKVYFYVWIPAFAYRITAIDNSNVKYEIDYIRDFTNIRRWKD